MARTLGIRGQRQQIQINTKERYDLAYLKYISGQFTYDSHCLIKKLSLKAEQQKHINQKTLYLMLIQISKLMMLNELQLLFFGATLQEMKWKLGDVVLTEYMDNIGAITKKGASDSSNKRTELSLLLIAYTVKKYLNEDIVIYDYKIREMFKNSFEKIYQEWVSKVQSTFKFSPKSMNAMFKEFDTVSNEKEEIIVDYNQRVHELVKDNIDNKIIQDQFKYSPNENSQIRGILKEEQPEQVPDELLPKTFSQRSFKPTNLRKKESQGLVWGQMDSEHGPQLPLSRIKSYQDQFGAN